VRGLLALLVLGCADPMQAIDGGAHLDASRADTGAVCTPVDFVHALADPLAPARRMPGHVTLVSSRSPEPPEGMHNDDFGHFVRTEGTHVVLADETGPGVITRLWFTYGPPMLGSISDVPLTLAIDGHDVISDVPLRDVAGPDSTLFPSPWSLDPATSSGGLSISSPLQYEESARVELVVAAGSWAYYQVDVRRLPPDACVRSFTGTYTASERADLESGAALWERHEHPGDDTSAPGASVAAGASVSLHATGPGAVTVVEVRAPIAARSNLTVRITVDGDVAADASLARLTGSAPPAGTYTSAFTASSADAATLYAPIPFARDVSVVVTNESGAAVPIGLRMRTLAMPSIDADVGRLHVSCAEGTASIPVAAVQPPFADTFANIVLAQTSDGPGQFAGLTTFQTTPGDPWYWALEADHEIAVDGAYDVLGTGTEDYFGGAFYFMNGPYTSVTMGTSGWDRPTSGPPYADAHTHLYRHHIVDTIPFDHELRFEMESYVNGTEYATCAWFYLFP
jgi:hypothetical protein